MTVPRIATAAITYSENAGARALVGRTFTSIAALDRAVGDAFAAVPPEPDASDKTDFRLTWTDGAEHAGTIKVSRELIAISWNGIVYTHLRNYQRSSRSPRYLEIARARGIDVDAAQQWADEVLRRLDDDLVSNPRPLASPPIVEVTITFRRGRVGHLEGFPSLRAADAALAAMFARAVPTPEDAYGFVVTWEDGHTHEGNVDIRPHVLARVSAGGGIIRSQLHAYVASVRGPEGLRDWWRRSEVDRNRIRAWAVELERRLAYDARERKAPRGPRKAPRGPRNAPPVTAAATRIALSRVVGVELAWSENASVPRGRFPSIWAADAALADAFRREPPPPGRAYDKTDFVVRWDDGMTHTGRLDVTERDVSMAASRGGLLRGHLSDYARWLASDDYLRMHVGRLPGEEIAAAQAYGRDLAGRLAADLAAQVDPRARRNLAGQQRPRSRPSREGSP